jgi:hypothetical protein
LGGSLALPGTPSFPVAAGMDSHTHSACCTPCSLLVAKLWPGALELQAVNALGATGAQMQAGAGQAGRQPVLLPRSGLLEEQNWRLALSSAAWAGAFLVSRPAVPAVPFVKDRQAPQSWELCDVGHLPAGTACPQAAPGCSSCPWSAWHVERCGALPMCLHALAAPHSHLPDAEPLSFARLHASTRGLPDAEPPSLVHLAVAGAAHAGGSAGLAGGGPAAGSVLRIWVFSF